MGWLGCVVLRFGLVVLFLDLRGDGDGGYVLPCYITYLDLGDGGCVGDVLVCLGVCVCECVCVTLHKQINKHT